MCKDKDILDGISIILSAYKTQDYIEECLDSIINQKTKIKYEVLLGIDGCEETLKKVKSILNKYSDLDFHVYYSEENVGTYILCNSLIKKSKYNYITRFDSDDIMFTNYIEYNSKFLQDYECIYPKAIMPVNGEDIIINTRGQFFLKKDIFFDLNGFDDFRVAGDYDLQLRLKNNNNKIKITNKSVLYKRVRKDSLQHNKEVGMWTEYRNKIHDIIENRDITKIDELKTTGLHEILRDPDLINGISVIISAYQAQDFIEECLDSVAKQKTNFKYEILLGIDGCEKTLEKVKEIMNKYIHLDFHVYYSEENVGTYILCNSLIEKSKYNYFARFDSDDIMMEDYLEYNGSYINENLFIIPKGIHFENTLKLDNISYKETNCEGQLIWNKNIFLDINGFDDYRCSMDSDLLIRFIRIFDKSKVIRPSKSTYYRRKHNNSLTKNQETKIDGGYRNDIIDMCWKRENNKLDKFKTIRLEKILNLKERILNKAKERNFELDLDNPKTISDKLNWLQLYDDKNNLKTKCADKILLHEYSKEKLGKDICVDILEIYDSPNDIDFDKLPNQYVLKCNHGFNMNFIIINNKEILNEEMEEIKDQLKEWLNTPFGEKSVEPHYLGIERKCFAEKFLQEEESDYIDDNYGGLIDYKFWCFNGVPRYVQIISNRYNINKKSNYYDMDFNFIDMQRYEIPNDPNQLDIKPIGFELMKEYAKKLSEDFRYVRVDFYEVNGIVYLGELTFTPNACFIKHINTADDIKLGNILSLN